MCAFCTASNVLLESNIHNYNHVHITINYVETARVRMCGLVSTSFLFVAMAVADGIAAQSIFYAGEFDLLNSIHRKIQDDPEGNLRYD